MDYTQVSFYDRIKYAVIWWGLTALLALYFIPATVIVYANPFWFRETLHRSVQSQLRRAAKWRKARVQTIVDKYATFGILKTV